MNFYKKVYTVQKKIDTLSISDYNKKYFVDKTLGHIYLYGRYSGMFLSIMENQRASGLRCGTGLLGMYAKYLGSIMYIITILMIYHVKMQK